MTGHDRLSRLVLLLLAGVFATGVSFSQDLCLEAEGLVLEFDVNEGRLLTGTVSLEENKAPVIGTFTRVEEGFIVGLDLFGVCPFFPPIKFTMLLEPPSLQGTISGHVFDCDGSIFTFCDSPFEGIGEPVCDESALFVAGILALRSIP